MSGIEPFTAVAKCPSCGHIDYHRMRDPHPAPSPSELERWEREHVTNEIQRWGTGQPVAVIHNPPRPIDESVFEIIRVCRCGHEWGQA